MALSAGTNQTFSRFQDLTKLVYSNKVNDLVPEHGFATEDIPFAQGNRVGDEYVTPVTLTRSGGHTDNADGSVFQLNRALSYATEQAKVRGNEIVSRETMSYAVMKRAMTGTGSKAGDKRAFVNATRHTMQRLVEGAKFAREVGLFYGCGSATAIPTNANLGVLFSVTDGTGTLTVVLTEASWATGLWVGCEGFQYDMYSPDGTKQNTGGTAGATDSVYTLTTVTPSTRTLVFTSANANTAAPAANDVILPAGAYQKEQFGLAAVVNTSGTVWNISNSAYGLWKPKTVAVGNSQLTYEAIQTGCAKAFEYGYKGTIVVYANPFSWQDLADDEAALINYASKTGGELTKGFNKLTFTSQTGKVVIKAHNYMKQGFAYGVPVDETYRVGSTDITFDMGDRGEMVRHLEDYAGMEARCYQDQALFCEKPCGIIEWSDIVNTKSSAS
jgi:hypothetical protein